jgi:hypothetical protein
LTVAPMVGPASAVLISGAPPGGPAAAVADRKFGCVGETGAGAAFATGAGSTEQNSNSRIFMWRVPVLVI